jgi:hypothetical protein
MVGSFAEAFGPAAFFLRRPIRVVGCGGGSYLGFSFCRRGLSAHVNFPLGTWSFPELEVQFNGPSLTCHLFHPRQAGLHQVIVDFPKTRRISKLGDKIWTAPLTIELILRLETEGLCLSESAQ